MALEDYTPRRTDIQVGDGGRIDDVNVVHDAMNDVQQRIVFGELSQTALAELIRDVIGAALVEGQGIDIAVDDTLNLITIAAVASPTAAIVPVYWTGSSWPSRTATNHMWFGGVLASPPPNIAVNEVWVKQVGV